MTIDKSKLYQRFNLAGQFRFLDSSTIFGEKISIKSRHQHHHHYCTTQEISKKIFLFKNAPFQYILFSSSSHLCLCYKPFPPLFSTHFLHSTSSSSLCRLSLFLISSLSPFFKWELLQFIHFFLNISSLHQQRHFLYIQVSSTFAPSFFLSFFLFSLSFFLFFRVWVWEKNSFVLEEGIGRRLPVWQDWTKLLATLAKILSIFRHF